MVYSLEHFDTSRRHARTFGLPAGQTCESARRALLSHGYLVQRSSVEQVDGRKSFQPSPDAHVEIEFHVVCTREGPEKSTVYVNALQERYEIKKTSGSASVGVGPLGSVSLPFWSGSDSMVKIASETIPAGDFYDRFFALIEHQLAQAEVDPADDPANAILPALVTVPAAAPAAPAAAAPAGPGSQAPARSAVPSAGQAPPQAPAQASSPSPEQSALPPPEPTPPVMGGDPSPVPAPPQEAVR
jgi:hypothetical protein